MAAPFTHIFTGALSSIWVTHATVCNSTDCSGYSKKTTQVPHYWPFAFQNVVCKMGAILFGPECVKKHDGLSRHSVTLGAFIYWYIVCIFSKVTIIFIIPQLSHCSSIVLCSSFCYKWSLIKYSQIHAFRFCLEIWTFVWKSYGTSIYILTHWGRVTHICVGNLTTIGSDNGLSPGRLRNGGHFYRPQCVNWNPAVYQATTRQNKTQREPCAYFLRCAVQVSSHYSDVIMGSIASQITSLTIVYSSVCSGADQRKHQSSASLAFVQGIHRRPVNSPHKGPVTRKLFPFDDVIMDSSMLQVLVSIYTELKLWNHCYCRWLST